MAAKKSQISSKTVIIIFVFLLTLYKVISSKDIRKKHKSIKYYVNSEPRYPQIQHNNLAGYPAPPKGKWAYPPKIHPNVYDYQQTYNEIDGPRFESSKALHSSSNDVINNSVWQEDLEWDFTLDPDVCHNMAGLTRSQLHLCHKYPDTTAVAAIGLKLAVNECQKQLKDHRWNCTSLSTHVENPHVAPIMSKGYSETAFVHAITAAGITHSVARACAAGKLFACSCGSVKGKRAWKWSGCHDNTKFGARFSRTFLDIREKSKDILSFTHLYNNEVGRKIVRRNRKVHCKCHGMSGSCEMRTCWKAVPSFRSVGKLLVEKLDNAKLASHTVFGNSADKLTTFKPIRREITVNSPLLYAEESPTFCYADRRLGVLGTLGRTCNRTSRGQDSCSTLCCGRGYNVVRKKIIRKCQCRFKWCCHVSCKDCIHEEWITVCK